MLSLQTLQMFHGASVMILAFINVMCVMTEMGIVMFLYPIWGEKPLPKACQKTTYVLGV